MSFWFFVFLIIAIASGVYIGNNPKKAFKILVPLTLGVFKFIIIYGVALIMFGVGFWLYGLFNNYGFHFMPEYPIIDTVMAYVFGACFFIYTIYGLGIWMTRNDNP